MTDAQAAALVPGDRVYVPIPHSVRIETVTVSHEPIGLSDAPRLGTFVNVEVAGRIQTLRSDRIYNDGREAVVAHNPAAAWKR